MATNQPTAKPKVELLVDGHDGSGDAIARIEASNETPGLKTRPLGVVLLDQCFAIEFDERAEAETVASRFRLLGFVCKVWNGPDPKDRVGYRESN